MKYVIAMCSLLLVLAATPKANAHCGACGVGDAKASTDKHHPAGKQDIVETAAHASQFSTLVTALKAAGLVNTLKAKGPYTVFAPTNEAFAKLPKGTLDNLLKAENKKTLTAILTYHVVPGKVMAKDVKAGNVKTVEGSQIKVSTKKGVMVDRANVTGTDILASNGVIHTINQVIVPKDVKLPKS